MKIKNQKNQPTKTKENREIFQPNEHLKFSPDHFIGSKFSAVCFGLNSEVYEFAFFNNLVFFFLFIITFFRKIQNNAL